MLFAVRGENFPFFFHFPEAPSFVSGTLGVRACIPAAWRERVDEGQRVSLAEFCGAALRWVRIRTPAEQWRPSPACSGAPGLGTSSSRCSCCSQQQAGCRRSTVHCYSGEHRQV